MPSEPLEVREEGGEIFWRENGRFACFRPPERFETQHGSFENHDRGEFGGWLESAGDPERLRIFGNFCDMFDCGAYSFAVSNLMHRGAGDFWLMRIDAGLNSAAVFSNKAISGRDFDIRRVGGSEGRWRSFDYEYLGRFRNGRGYALLLRGWKRVEGYGTRHRTLLLQTGPEGGCSVDGEWETKLSSAYSLAVCGGCVYFGNDKTVTRLELSSGEASFFTNKTEEELAALAEL